jgi:predicted Ser/Thr protein kinase
MGFVYEARQQHLDRLVALKILPSRHKGDAAFAQRFQQEARTLAQLSHPNIVAIHDFGRVSGLYYLLMEYVDGTNLRTLLRQNGRLKPRDALHVIEQVCRGLEYAHAEGIVHRDIKPENVLLDKKNNVKIADFGLAKLLFPSKRRENLTDTSQAMGTPYYAAPEQVEHPQTVDHRADIYSLGVVFYEMLTGNLPVGNFGPPSTKVRLDARLDRLVLRALEESPERRFQHVSELETEMEAITRESLSSSRRHGAEMPKGIPVATAVLIVAPPPPPSIRQPPASIAMIDQSATSVTTRMRHRRPVIWPWLITVLLFAVAGGAIFYVVGPDGIADAFGKNREGEKRREGGEKRQEGKNAQAPGEEKAKNESLKVLGAFSMQKDEDHYLAVVVAIRGDRLTPSAARFKELVMEWPGDEAAPPSRMHVREVSVDRFSLTLANKRVIRPRDLYIESPTGGALTGAGYISQQDPNTPYDSTEFVEYNLRWQIPASDCKAPLAIRMDGDAPIELPRVRPTEDGSLKLPDVPKLNIPKIEIPDIPKVDIPPVRIPPIVVPPVDIGPVPRVPGNTEPRKREGAKAEALTAR